MKTDTAKKILEYIIQKGQVTVQDLILYLGYSPQAIHRQLKKLVENSQLQKIGTPPRVYYQIHQSYEFTLTDYNLNPGLSNKSLDDLGDLADFVEDKFIQILPNGTELKGGEAFVYWCNQRGFKVLEYAQKYQEIYEKYESYKNTLGLINATIKLKNTYKQQTFLDKLFYLEFSALEIFGKTKSYSHLLYSKLNQDRKLMIKMFDYLQIFKKVNLIVDLFDIQAIGFVAPTVPRKIQIQKELEKYLALNLPKIEIHKIQTPILVPQKTLSTPNERSVNSQSTFVVPKFHTYKKILLIDDFTGSGATLNFIAKKILDKSQYNNTQIYGLSLCGTPNGIVNNSQKFEIVKEV